MPQIDIAGSGRWYQWGYWAWLAVCWLEGGLMSTAAGAQAAQLLPGAARIPAWIAITGVLATACVVVCDPLAAALARYMVISPKGRSR